MNQELAAAIHQFTIDYIKENNLGDDNYENIYNFKKACLEREITRNPQILKEIAILPYLMPWQLNPEHWQEILERQRIKEEKMANITYSDVYTCPKCKQKKCITQIFANRAADEALAVLVSCKNCYHTFTI